MIRYAGTPALPESPSANTLTSFYYTVDTFPKMQKLVIISVGVSVITYQLKFCDSGTEMAEN